MTQEEVMKIAEEYAEEGKAFVYGAVDDEGTATCIAGDGRYIAVIVEGLIEKLAGHFHKDFLDTVQTLIELYVQGKEKREK